MTTVRQALEWMANYNMTGTEQTLHIDMQGKAREVLPALDALEAKIEAANQSLDVIDRRADDALVALYGIDYEEGSRVDRAVEAVEAIRAALTAQPKGETHE